MDEQPTADDHRWLFTTPRLRIRRAGPADVDLFLALWTAAQVMANVGFPRGLPITRAQIEALLAAEGPSPLDALLVVERAEDRITLGECKLGRPDETGLATTDIKLLPTHWGQGYGSEIKRGLLAYLFTRTKCRIVEATPNVANAASIRLQEAVGGVRVGAGTYHFPPHMADFTCPVPHFVYHVRREAWRAARQLPPDSPKS